MKKKLVCFHSQQYISRKQKLRKPNWNIDNVTKTRYNLHAAKQSSQSGPISQNHGSHQSNTCKSRYQKFLN